jgi:hypothetical protein
VVALKSTQDSVKFKIATEYGTFAAAPVELNKSYQRAYRQWADRFVKLAEAKFKELRADFVNRPLRPLAAVQPPSGPPETSPDDHEEHHQIDSEQDSLTDIADAERASPARWD